MKAFCLAVLSLGILSCQRSHSSSAPAEKTSPPAKTIAAQVNSATISASPNPVPPSAGDGETTITWDTGTAAGGQVYVSKNGQPEQLLSSRAKGADKVKWIHVRSRYQFRLYTGTAHSQILAKVDVEKQK